MLSVRALYTALGNLFWRNSIGWHSFPAGFRRKIFHFSRWGCIRSCTHASLNDMSCGWCPYRGAIGPSIAGQSCLGALEEQYSQKTLSLRPDAQGSMSQRWAWGLNFQISRGVKFQGDLGLLASWQPTPTSHLRPGPWGKNNLSHCFSLSGPQWPAKLE